MASACYRRWQHCDCFIDLYRNRRKLLRQGGSAKGCAVQHYGVNPQEGSNSKSTKAAHFVTRRIAGDTVRPFTLTAVSQRKMRFLHPSSDLSRIAHCRAAAGQGHLKARASPTAGDCRSRAPSFLRLRQRKQPVLRATAVQEVIPMYMDTLIVVFAPRDGRASAVFEGFPDIKCTIIRF